ncbi:MAG: protein-methionine-sulfoxide reductase catalytic subunit MsrP [Hyphomicrobiales bacterium]|nr:protein-methionine-sulfoxide reductase catalytic subunit MsrP [Hyphomicrobiales bacterium]
MKPNNDKITPKHLYMNRRKILKIGLFLSSMIALNKISLIQANEIFDRKINTFEEITNYNNFYEFGVDKTDPAKYAHKLNTSPWTVEIAGMVENPGIYSFDEIYNEMDIEERIYSLRCVEGWSMLIPWNGFQLSNLLNKVGVKDGAKYVGFETLFRPEEMHMQKTKVLQWPYSEGLRIDEAMHPLTLMATGVYGNPLPKQNGAPIRLIVPWKYGFKSIKSIAKITIQKTEPNSSWNIQNQKEYGFYSNVNPNVHHPRWSQASERYIGGEGEGFLGNLFTKRYDTKIFNGYKEVASLYDGMDLAKYY